MTAHTYDFDIDLLGRVDYAHVRTPLPSLAPLKAVDLWQPCQWPECTKSTAAGSRGNDCHIYCRTHCMQAERERRHTCQRAEARIRWRAWKAEQRRSAA